MKKTNHREVWLATGYDLFAEEGHEGIQIERLARITGLNKSGFYHYFGDRFVFFDELVECHKERADGFIDKIDNLKDIDPSLIELLIEEKAIVFFDMQLNRNREVSVFKNAFEDTAKLVSKRVLPIWREYLGVPEEVAAESWEFMRDAFNARITYKNFSFEVIHEMVSKFRDIIRETHKID